MRNTVFSLGVAVLAVGLVAGCSGPETKLGRGFGNMTEIVRMGEMQRSIEQGGLFDGPDVGITTGAVKGFDRTIARTGLGLFEVVTFPIPPYRPIWTNYLAPKPVYPDAYKPTVPNWPLFDTDQLIGFSGGNIAPSVPGNRFSVFDN